MIYVGILPLTSAREVFTMRAKPTADNCKYAAVIGPFRTRKGAEFMARNGFNNPHCQGVADAERLAKIAE